MEARSSTMVVAAKLPLLNPGEFELWKMMIEQYFLMTDYALLEVIVNGDSPPLKRIIDGVEQTYPPTTAEEKLARKNKLKARGTLLMALPNEHQLKFNTYKCAKTLMEAIEKRFGGNKESKKTQKTLLKQQYENFNGSSSEGLDQTYDRLQKLISQLEILGETISQEDMNLKFLMSLPSEWKTHTLIWRNKPHLDTLSMDDLYNNLKIYETKIDADDLEEMDLKWQMAMLTMRARRFLNKTGRKINANGSETIGFNKSKVECYNCHKKGHFARECRAPRENRNREPVRRNVTVETTETKALVAQDGLGYDWSDQAEEGPTNFALMAYTSSGSSSSDSEVSTCSKACLKSYETLKEHYDNLTKDFNKSQLNVGAYKASLESVELRDNALTELRKKFEKAKKERDDLKLTLEKFGNSSKNLSKLLEIQVSDKFKTGVGFDSQMVDSHVFDNQENDSEAKTSMSKPKSVGEPLIEDWISDSEDKNETEFKSKQRKPSFAKTEFVKSNEHVKTTSKSVKKVENKKQAKYPRKNNQSPRVNNARTASNVFSRAHTHVRRPFNKSTTNKNSNLKEKVNTVKGNVTTAGPKAVVSDNKGNEANAVKASACWVWRPKQKVLDHGNPQLELQEKGVIDSGCFRHMSGNKSHLSDYKEIDGGFVTFGGDPKGGRITGKGKISTGKLDFEDVYFVKELKFNLFSVSQMCDKKNSVLFTDTECVVLSPDFKLLDENHVLLRVPRKDNMYSVDLKNIVPSGGLTCLFAKATLDESNLWHRRLGHINFKTLNKLVRGNLVRGLPSKIFENNHTCVACQKGKQHKASCKTKTVSSISQPLQMLHMDLFGPTFVKSLMKKVYCLVVTDDYSRCDNGTEFKNKVMNQFCKMKGIKREFSVARTPQQNGVAERKNRTLIEAARTMLADSKLPTTFWAEAVNTACYVQNRVLVIKPHNKTPYELFLGRKHALSFMRPFGCPVTILNTLDHLGKFDGKADEGFFVGYSTNSKAYRVFNSRTRIVEENLHVKFSEETPNIAGNGPNWLFDIDALTISMNYKPVVAGNQTNGNAGIKENIDAGQARRRYSKDSPDARFKPSGEEEKIDSEHQENEDSEVPNTEEPRINQEQDANVNSTNNINIRDVVCVCKGRMDRGGGLLMYCYPNMPNFEEIIYSDDDEELVQRLT
ncbi:putative ribonuclease H-like domain-containing protein [Tanacetum coccineum]|uniref:Ribonuclease H-like domain-containing protein n=1 Tax=Tanacetum coccineum TaxID=301880 RepID=A0ABQ5DF34_9ASTR